MISTNKKPIPITLLEIILLLWPGIILVSIFSVMVNLFQPLNSVIFLFFCSFLLFYLNKIRKIKIQKPIFGEWLLLLILVIWVLTLSSFTTPTIFSGRDEGSFSSSALLISQDHKLTHQNKVYNTFGQIYGEGRALNFPGFFYQKDKDQFVLKSQFLPGYPSYLANFFLTKHPQILKYANSLPLMVLMLSFYLTINIVTKSKNWSLRGVLLLLSCLPFILFYKFTLSEIFFASLLWSSIYFLLKYLHTKNKPDSGYLHLIYFWFIFIPLLPTVFVRIEAVPLIFTLILILIFTSHQKLNLPKYQLPIIIIAILSFTSIVVFTSFFITALKGLLAHSPLTPNTQSTTHFVMPKNWRNFYLLKLFYTYNLLPLFFLAIPAIYKHFKEKKYLHLIPLFFLSPTLFYLIDANISTDHPWMLRRFVFSIIPLGVIYSILFLQDIKNKMIGNFIVSVLIISNLFLGLPFLLFQQNHTLLNQVKKLSQNFQNNDLILVSQKSSGFGWSLISAPLRNIFNKQAAYFFNPNDFDKIDQQNYSHIYLIVSDKEKSLYQDLINFNQQQKYQQQKYLLENQIIQPSKNPLHLPNFIKQKTTGTIYQLK